LSWSLQNSPETRIVEEGDRFDALDYALYLRRRWSFIAVSCIVAIALAIVVGMLMPNRYTSTASILIEPPAGTDTRTFTAISPIYLESLRTYETFATSGSLFQQALDKFKLRDSESGSIEAIKSRVLKVTKIRDTKVLQISVTLQDPKQAQAMAQYLAEETVKLISNVTRANGRDVLEDIRTQTSDAKKRLDDSQAAFSRANETTPVTTLRSELDSMIELQYRVRRDLYEAEASAAAYDSQGAKARVELLTKRAKELDDSVRSKSRVLAEATSQIEKLEADRRTAQSIYDASIRRQQELQSWTGSSGERLQIIDRGIVPEKPSEPRPMLYAALASSLALLGSIVYLSVRYGMLPRR
jgi:uncharacterized protein involved in exopolysaccharide biosynthesis